MTSQNANRTFPRRQSPTRTPLKRRLARVRSRRRSGDRANPHRRVARTRRPRSPRARRPRRRRAVPPRFRRLARPSDNRQRTNLRPQRPVHGRPFRYPTQHGRPGHLPAPRQPRQSKKRQSKKGRHHRLPPPAPHNPQRNRPNQITMENRLTRKTVAHTFPIQMRSSHTARKEMRLRRSNTLPAAAPSLPFLMLFQASLALIATN